MDCLPGITSFEEPIIADLATKWEQADPVTFIFTLNPKAVWQDRGPANGRQMVAEDVKFTYERYMGGGVTKARFEPVAKVEAVDKTIVKITLKRRTPDILDTFAFEHHAILNPEYVATENNDLGNGGTNYVGSGPFIQQFGLPVLVVGVRLSASTLRFTRAGMLEVLNEDYIRTARAKGLRPSTVVMRHALRNALIPIVTIVGIQMAYLFGGAVVMETLFSLPGIGQLTVSSVKQLDYVQVQTNVMVFAIVTVFINFLVDATYAVIDPRIRLH